MEKGRKFGKLTVRWNGGTKEAKWHCLCECGKDVHASEYSLLSGRRTACMSCQLGKKRRPSGSGKWINSPRVDQIHLRAARAYLAAKSACLRPKHVNWPNYGGRGIEFKFKSFDEFFEELGERPAGKFALDRIDVNGHYEKGNVRWVPYWASAHNKRRWGKSSKYRGVYPDSRRKTPSWYISFTRNGKSHSIGNFKTELEAAHAWDEIAPKYFGEYALLNFPSS